ncbi:MAG: VCBS repeat-containing protein [Bryobacteraceae bacterium]|nr:VCBS repeat-containing protein [Bryobacteraceae bacterium]
MKLVSAVLVGSAMLLFAVSRPAEIPFEKRMLDGGANETCALADINGDKRLDIVSGDNWYEAPSWTKHHFRDLPFTNNYVDAFSDLPLDINGDGRIDIITVSWFSKRIIWSENPGRGGTWKEHILDSGSPVEFAFLVDLNNDGKAEELLPQFGDDKRPLAWWEVRDGAMVKHIASNRSYGHGIGAGDVNKDGRTDILTPEGWLESPADPKSSDWMMHAGFPKGTAMSFLHVHDVNGDGRNDVVVSQAHDYGIFWLEQNADGSWKKNVIDDSWSQGHAISLVDLNGDGQKDILTGKRFMAHNGRDPGEKEPLGIYWYEQLRAETGNRIEWVKHVIDYGGRTGAGMQIPVADLDGDGDLDFAVGGKSGLFLFENQTKKLATARR